MKKRNLLLLPLFALLLAGCKPTPTPSVSDSELPPDVVSSQEEVVEEKTIAQIRAMTKDGDTASSAQKELKYRVKGIVTTKFRGANITNVGPAWNISIQDGNDALLLYAITEDSYEANFKNVKVGDELEVIGYLAAHNGLRELDGIKYVSHKAATAIVPEVLTSIDQTKLAGKDSKLVKIEGLKLMSKPTLKAEMEGDRSNITINMDIEKAGVKIGTYMHYNIPMEDAQAAVAKLEKVTSNSTLAWTGILGMNGGIFQLTNVGAEEWDVVLGDAVTLKSLEFTKDTVSVKVGETAKTAVKTSPWDGPVGTLVYESKDVTVATVDQDGVITGVKAGTTKVTVASGDVVGEIEVVVKSDSGVVTEYVVIPEKGDLAEDKSADISVAANAEKHVVGLPEGSTMEATVVFVGRGGGTSSTDSMPASYTVFKFGSSKANGTLTFTLPEGTKIASVEVQGRAWNTDKAKLTVNGITKDFTNEMPANKEDIRTFGFEFTEESNVISFASEKRVILTEIKLQLAGGAVEPDTPDYPTIEEVRALADNADIETFGVITGIARSSSNPSYQNHMLVTIQYGDHAIQTYNAIDAQVDDLKVGDLVHVVGKKSTYNGLVQISPTSLIEKLDLAAPEIVPFEVVEFTEAALTGMSSRLVSVKGLVYVSGEVTAEGNSTDSPIKFKFGDVEVTLQISKHFLESDRAEMKALIEGLETGDTVDFTGPLGWFKTPQLNGMNASMLKVNKA